MSNHEKTVKIITHQFLRNYGWEPDKRPVRQMGPKQEGQVDGPNHPFLYLNRKCLVGLDFSDLDLKFAIFEDCDLSSASFERCNLYKAAFINCILYNTIFNKAILVDVKFNKSKLFGIRLQEAEVHGLGDCKISFLMSREHGINGELIFRGTAGYSEWKDIIDEKLLSRDTAFSDDMSNEGIPHRVIDLPDGNKLILGINNFEIVETCPLFSDLLRERWEIWRNRTPASFLALNYPRPPGDAFPEDSTCMTLRDFRRCFERQGNRYPASEFRFWETTYLAASKLRVVQSKILQVNANETSRRWRWLFSLPVAFLAWSLLHPEDERRKSGVWGHKRIIKGFSSPQENSKLKTKFNRLKSILTWCGSQFNGNSAIGFCLHISILFVFLFGGLSGFLKGPCWGIGIATVFIAIVFGIPVFCMMPKKSSLLIKYKETIRAIENVYLAGLEFIQHTTCGHGEKPLRAAGTLGGWIVLFGVLYSVLPSNHYGALPPHHLGNGVLHMDRGLYYSVVSATTLGFGDITPGSPLTEGLVCIEVVGAVILTAILLASLTRKFIGR